MNTCNSAPMPSAALVEIQDVSVDISLPRETRISEFLRQIKNPYHFQCGTIAVKARFTQDGPTLEDCLQRLLT